MADANLAAYLLAAFLSLWGVSTSRFDRWVFGPGGGASRKFAGYGVLFLSLWLLTAVAMWIYGGRRLLGVPGSPASPIFAVAAVPLLAAFCVLALMPLIQSLRGARWREAYAAAIRREYAHIPGFLPNNSAERMAWIVLSLTAGICEEVLFRGFLIRFLHESSFALPIVGALAVSSMLFGLGHLYQGTKGIVTTTVSGFCFGLLFLLSGSLLLPMVLHALIDLQGAYIMRPVRVSAAMAAAEMA
jgi:membrane protease YdiL (CAAX protease family)